LHISNRWLALFSITFFLSLSGLIHIAQQDQLFLRSSSESFATEKTVKGIASQSARAGFVSSQIQVLSIGTKKYTPPVSNLGTSKQVGEHTWTITVNNDKTNATAGKFC